LDQQLIISIAASAIALCALVATIWQAYITRKHNRLSVRPILNFNVMTENSDFVLSLKNTGFGPAIITDYQINFNDESLGDNSDEIAINLSEELEIGSYNKRMYFPGKGQAIAPGEFYRLIKISKILQDDDDKEKFKNDILWLEVKINYESIYSEKFSISGPDFG